MPCLTQFSEYIKRKAGLFDFLGQGDIV